MASGETGADAAAVMAAVDRWQKYMTDRDNIAGIQTLLRSSSEVLMSDIFIS